MYEPRIIFVGGLVMSEGEGQQLCKQLTRRVCLATPSGTMALRHNHRQSLLCIVFKASYLVLIYPLLPSARESFPYSLFTPTFLTLYTRAPHASIPPSFLLILYLSSSSALPPVTRVPIPCCMCLSLPPQPPFPSYALPHIIAVLLYLPSFLLLSLSLLSVSFFLSLGVPFPCFLISYHL